MSSTSRKLSYAIAINEALTQLMEADPSVLLIGQGVKSPWYVGATACGLLDRFGPERVIDTPVSENAITGAAVGAAIAGMKPVVVHPRMDFMFFGLDPLLNQAANWRYMSGGRSGCPVVFWGIVNRGGEQAAQHSQSIHAMFAHAPGLKVVMPSTPYDAKGLMVSAIQDPDPVVFVDERWLYGVEGEVPEDLYQVPIGQAAVRTTGTDVTIAATSYAAHLATRAHTALEKEGIKAEIIDLRSAKPLDEETLTASVTKTGRAIVVDGGWRTCGFSAEVSTVIHEKCFAFLKAPVVRVAIPDIPAPAARTLEEAYYYGVDAIVNAARRLISG
jgi:pyruvate/2-oxoglutarate/acetoin dehydrogenase E1 component